MRRPMKTIPIEDLEDVVDEVLALVGGDPRQAIMALVRGQHDIAAELSEKISAGYERRGTLH
ncbi:hypothetical protein [Aureimonas psammosilenae]|uniref:hypothetical protein n=1 Tax=Aureimonas psammosilenae TaxID=2495496 RepID=UPI001260F9EE|nr:hypothetical protein [Aureimonas psammosilenae]